MTMVSRQSFVRRAALSDPESLARIYEFGYMTALERSRIWPRIPALVGEIAQNTNGARERRGFGSKFLSKGALHVGSTATLTREGR